MSIALHWFRRDLRARDNTALFTAAAEADSLAGIFVIDPRWFGNPGKTGPHQAAFWLASLRELSETLHGRGIPLIIARSADPVAAVLAAARQINATRITYNKDYEPDQIAQDDRLEREAAAAGLVVTAYKDQVVFEEHDILTGAGTVFSVFTPYKRAWLKELAGKLPTPYGLPRRPIHPLSVKPTAVPEANSLGYSDVTLDLPTGETGAAKLLHRFSRDALTTYHTTRNIPSDDHGTSRLSAHLAAGTISSRQVLAAVGPDGLNPRHEGPATFVSELIWREFYKMILFSFPHTVSKPFQDKYVRITWANNPDHVAAWQEGHTGYPIVDAGMRQLRATGFMHNRLRMLTAMFLTKHLDCHWTIGERFFMRTLIDYDQAANVGGWQWSASTGTDAAPYFRVMNPTLQSQRFDPDGVYIRRWVPELARVPNAYIHAPWEMPPAVQREANCILGTHYPPPIVDHAAAREQAIAKFKAT